MDKPVDLPQAVATVIRMTVAAKQMQAKDVYQAAGISKSVWDRSIRSMDRASALKLDQVAAISKAIGMPLADLMREAEAMVVASEHANTGGAITAQESAEIDDVIKKMRGPHGHTPVESGYDSGTIASGT